MSDCGDARADPWPLDDLPRCDVLHHRLGPSLRAVVEQAFRMGMAPDHGHYHGRRTRRDRGLDVDVRRAWIRSSASTELIGPLGTVTAATAVLDLDFYAPGMAVATFRISRTHIGYAGNRGLRAVSNTCGVGGGGARHRLPGICRHGFPVAAIRGRRVCADPAYSWRQSNITNWGSNRLDKFPLLEAIRHSSSA